MERQNLQNPAQSTSEPEPVAQPQPKPEPISRQILATVTEVRDMFREALNDPNESATLHTPIADAPPPVVTNPGDSNEPEPSPDPNPSLEVQTPSASSETNSEIDQLSVTTEPESELPPMTPQRKPGIWAGRRRR